MTGHALEDQLYLFGTVIPTVTASYGLNRPGFYINKDLTWVSVRYQSKPVTLFKHETLGLPNGRKTDLSIPLVIRQDARLMRHLTRELLATDGVVGFYNASHGPHKYPRIQIKISASQVIEHLANYEECKPRTSIKHRLSLLCDPSQSTATADTITCDELISLINQMRKSFGFPRVGGNELLQKISETNRRFDSTLGRKLPSLLDS